MLTPLAIPDDVPPDALPNARIPRVLQDRVTGVVTPTRTITLAPTRR